MNLDHPIYSAPATSITRADSGAGKWEVAARAPLPALGRFILGYLGIDSRIDLVRERHLPSGEAALLINLGPPWRALEPRNSTILHRRVTAIGVHDRYSITEATGTQRVLLVRLKPVAARLLFGVPMSELANRRIEADDLGSSIIPSDTSERLHECSTWAQRFAVLDAVMAHRLNDPDRIAIEVAWAWDRIHQAGGLISIEAIRKELGRSRKYLAAQFREHIGFTAKAAAQVLRFSRAIEIVEGEGAFKWADLAQRCGYFDQAHFIRDFRRFSGRTPSELVRGRAGFTFSG